MKKMILATLLTAFCMQAHALYITVNSPNGGESFARGEALTVNWVDNVSENVKIELLKNGSVLQTIANSTESDGSYQWQLPYDLTAGNDYKVKITSTLLNSITDQSDNSFTVNQGSVDLTYPAGGEALAKGSPCNIVWNDDILENVKIELFKNSTLERVIASSTESDGSFLWQIPSTGIEAASGYQVKISSTVTSLVTDQSGSFSVTGGYIEGNVSGFWPKSGSPYIIGADVTVPVNQTLTIEPGSEVLFNAPAQFTVQGRLLAQGTKEQKIRFAPQDTSKYWYGLNFEKSEMDTSKVEYCEITGVKADSWVKKYGYGRLNAIAATSDGGFVGVGETYSYSGKILKLDACGNLVWQIDNESILYSVAVFDNFIVAVGDKKIVKIDSNGIVIDQISTSFCAKSIAKINDNSFVCASYSNSSMENHIVMYNSSLDVQWSYDFNNYSIYSIEFNKLLIDNGNIVACGSLWSAYPYGYLIKLDMSGNLIWEKQYTTPVYTKFNDIIKEVNNYIVFSGWKVVSIDFNGNKLSEKEISNTVTSIPKSYYKDNDQNIIIIGTNGSINADNGFIITKINENCEISDQDSYIFSDTAPTSISFYNDDYWITGEFNLNAALFKLSHKLNFTKSHANVIINNSSKVSINNNNIIHNQSQGVYCSNANPILTNNLFTNNQGGIQLNHSSPIIANNTIVNNSTDNGTILYCDSASSPTLINNICYNNTATNGSTIYLNDAASDPNFLYNNLLGGLTSISGAGSGVNFSGQFIENMDINPQFTGNNDFSLKASSPCINAGYPGLDSSAFAQFGLPWSDLAGNPRLYNDRIDFGAYEFISDVRTVSGNITENANWYEDTVKVVGNVTIASGVKVLINRGTVVQFQGRYGFTVNGKIKASGIANQPVIFEAKNPATGWNGLYYPENSDLDSSFYFNCHFKHALADDGTPAVTIDDNGGLFRIKKGNKVVVSDCEIENIEAKNNGGAIWIDESDVQIVNCLFHHNKAGNQGGAIFAQNCNPLLLNNTLVYNQAVNGGSAFALQNSDALNYNNIIWFNTATTGNQIQLNDNNSDPDFKFCNIETGLSALSGNGSGDNFSGAWQENISGNPDFTGTKSGNSYALKSTSPCIDKGTPASSGFIFPLYDIDGNPRIYGSRIDIGAYEYTIVGLNGENTPAEVELKQNYPNPFNPSTMIVFTLPNTGYAELGIYNIKGELVKTMVKGVCQAGTQQLTFDGSAFASGMYYYRLTTPNWSIAKKMILLK